MNLTKLGSFLAAIILCALLTYSSASAQQQTETPQTPASTAQAPTAAVQPTIIRIFGVQLIIYSSTDKKEISKAPVNNTGAGGFKVSQEGKYFIKATFGKKVDTEVIKELKIDIKYPDGTRKTLTTAPASNGKSLESAEFEWKEPAKPLFAYLTSTQGKVNTLPMSEANKK